MPFQARIFTPKQLPDIRKIGLYSYYAGYSQAFVSSALEGMELSSADVVIDPWNGSGTTTAVATRLGLRSWGADINPAMAIVAKARLLGHGIFPSEQTLCESVLLIDKEIELEESDPLLLWFKCQTAQHLRRIERRISVLMDPSHELGPPSIGSRVSALSPLAAFFYLALFRITRDMMAPFKSSNPTWFKKPTDKRERVAIAKSVIDARFRHNVRVMARSIENLSLTARVSEKPGGAESAQHSHESLVSLASIVVANSSSLPLADSSATAALSSPPYCTRIDYAVATTPELAILGLTKESVKGLRQTMIGTSTVLSGIPEIENSWGVTCVDFLRRVALHPSKASHSYYLRNHLQYFAGLAKSIREIDRVLAPRSTCILVVQDSTYKEVHNDLPKILCEMGDSSGWNLVKRKDFNSPRHMGRIRQKLNTLKRGAIESVLVFETS